MAKYKPLDVRIDPEFESLIDPLTDEEYQQLKENIRGYGLLEKIKIWKEAGKGYYVIVDGHNRNRILKELAEEAPEDNWLSDNNYETLAVVLSTRSEIKEYIIKNQLGRRNLTPFQRTELALKLKPSIIEKAKKNQSTHKTGGYQGLENSSKAVDTRQEIATAAKVSTDTVRKVEKILDKASEEDKEKLRKGETTINRVFKTVSGNEKKKPLVYHSSKSDTGEKTSLLRFEVTSEKQEPLTFKIERQHPFDPEFLRKQQEQDAVNRLVMVSDQETKKKPLVFKRNAVNDFNLYEFCPSDLADAIMHVALLTGEKPGELIMRHVINNLQSDVEKLNCGIYDCKGHYDKQKIDDLSKEIETVTGIKADEWMMKNERMTGESRDYALNRIANEYFPGEIGSWLT